LGHQIDETVLRPKKVTKQRFRASIINEWEGRCAYCNCVPTGKITLDHVIPKTKGGQTTKENLVPCCIRCNGSKNHHDWRSWFQGVAWHCPVREEKIRAWQFVSNGESRAGDGNGSPELADF
jgi:hypothetical protein